MVRTVGVTRMHTTTTPTSGAGFPSAKLERIVIAALRDRLYTPENPAALVAQVRDDLLARAKQET